MLQQFTRALARATRARLCPFVVVDTYGTNKPVWSRAEAMQWLSVCSPEASVFHRRTWQRMAGRSVGRT